MKRGVDQSVINWHYEQKIKELEAEVARLRRELSDAHANPTALLRRLPPEPFVSDEDDDEPPVIHSAGPLPEKESK